MAALETALETARAEHLDAEARLRACARELDAERRVTRRQTADLGAWRALRAASAAQASVHQRVLSASLAALEAEARAQQKKDAKEADRQRKEAQRASKEALKVAKASSAEPEGEGSRMAR